MDGEGAAADGCYGARAQRAACPGTQSPETPHTRGPWQAEPAAGPASPRTPSAGPAHPAPQSLSETSTGQDPGTGRRYRGSSQAHKEPRFSSPPPTSVPRRSVTGSSRLTKSSGLTAPALRGRRAQLAPPTAGSAPQRPCAKAKSHADAPQAARKRTRCVQVRLRPPVTCSLATHMRSVAVCACALCGNSLRRACTAAGVPGPRRRSGRLRVAHARFPSAYRAVRLEPAPSPSVPARNHPP